MNQIVFEGKICFIAKFQETDLDLDIRVISMTQKHCSIMG